MYTNTALLIVECSHIIGCCSAIGLIQLYSPQLHILGVMLPVILLCTLLCPYVIIKNREKQLDHLKNKMEKDLLIRYIMQRYPSRLGALGQTRVIRSLLEGRTPSWMTSSDIDSLTRAIIKGLN